jgi:ABC-2 type transport system ATP-binding protein
MTELNEVIAYIHEARAVGLSDDAITQALAGIGWQEPDIRRAFLHAAAVPATHQHGPTAGGVDEFIIQARGLSKRYGNLVAVDGVSFEVFRGETFGILGPNGAGKTTTLEMIEGLKRASHGMVLVDGLDVAHHAHAVKSIIGVQLQASTFLEGLNLMELLETFAACYGRRIDPMVLLAEVQLTDKASSKVKELSGGQKQRFSIAAGLVNDPKVLFLDEPTTGLDPQARRHLWELIKQIKRRGTTVVLTTHYMDEAEVLCDRVAIMDGGKIVALDSPRTLIRNLLDSGFAKHVVQEQANLEDVFLKLTGHDLRD